MEMVAWLAGEPHTDEPRCACPVLGAVVRAANDAADDAARTPLLRPLVPLLVGSRTDPARCRRRAFELVDLAVRVLAPECLRRAGRTADAAQLEGLDPIVDCDTLATARSWARAAAPDQAELGWLLARASSEDPAEAWIAAVVRIARPLGSWGLGSVIASVRRTLLATRRRRPVRSGGSRP